MKESLWGLLMAWTYTYNAAPVWTTAIGVGAAMTLFFVLSRGFLAACRAKAEIAGGPLLLLAATIVCALCLLWAGVDGLLAWSGAPLLSERLVAALAPDVLSLSSLANLPGELGVAGAKLREFLQDQGLPDVMSLSDLDRLGDVTGAPGTLAQSPAVKELVQLLQKTRLPAGVTMPLGLFAAVLLTVAIASLLANTLAEMLALQKKPEDIIRLERRKELEAEARAREAAREAEKAPDQEAAPEAGQDATEKPPVHAGAPGTAGAAPASDPPVPKPPLPAEPEPPLVPLSDDLLGRIYKLGGHYHSYLHAELRFLRWQKPLAITLHSLAGMGVATTVAGTLPVPLWVAVVLFSGAFARLAALPAPRPAVPETPGAEPGSESGDPARPHLPAFAERAGLASGFALVPPLPAPAAIAPKAPPVRGAPLLADIAAATGVSQWHAHQAAAMAAFDARASVLVHTAPGSGRELLLDALALYAVLADAEHVLVLCPDAAAARAAHARFHARAEATHWKWNILAVDLTDRAGAVDPGQAQPGLVFTDPQAVHRRLCGQPERWRTFLAGLGAVLVPDVHAYSGAPAAHLAQLLRRLDRAVGRARSPSLSRDLLLSPEPGALRFVLTAHPAHAALVPYAERLIGRPVQAFGPDHDTAPRPRQDHRVVVSLPHGTAEAEHAVPAVALARIARRMGYDVAFHGYDRLLTRADRAPEAASDQAGVVIARLAPRSAAGLPVAAMHAGSVQAPRATVPSVAVLWQPDPTPMARLFAAHAASQPNVPETVPAPALIAWPGAPEVERAHLHATLAEAEVTADELFHNFSRDIVNRELTDLAAHGHLIERTRSVLDPAAGAVRRVRTLALAAGHDVHSPVSLLTCARPVSLCERATGEVLGHLEGPCAPAAAYPGRVFVAGGRRFVVLDRAAQDQLDHGRIVCEPTTEPVMSAPIRILDIEPVERRRDSEPAPDERRGDSLCSVGGARFSMQHRPVTVTETVRGVRRVDLMGRGLDSALYDRPITCTFAGRAAILAFVPDELPFSEPVSAAVLHALSHGFAQAAAALIAHDETDLAVVSLPAGERRPVPALAVVDLHPGGAGFADAVTLDVVRRLARWTLALIDACPDACAAGCPGCLHTWDCDAPGELHQHVDKVGARALLTALLASD